MSTYHIVAAVVVGVLLIVGVLVLVRSAGEPRAAREMRMLPKMPIASVSEGRAVRIVGTVELGDRTLTSPMTGRVCAHYAIEIWDRRERTPGDDLRVVARESKQEPFMVRDATGTILIDPEGAEFLLTRAAVHVDAQPGLHDAVLARHSIVPLKDVYEIHEQALVANATVAVAGIVTSSDGRPMLRGGGPIRLRVSDMRSVLRT